MPADNNSQNKIYNVIVVGSGPAGANIAHELVTNKCHVLMLDIGHQDLSIGEMVPDLHFDEIRKSDPCQRDYFLGQNLSAFNKKINKAGAHLTPPREYMIAKTDEYFPTQSTDFYALQATSQGGLGVSWGSNCFTFNEKELEQTFLDSSPLYNDYEKTAEHIGVSGQISDINTKSICELKNIQCPLDLDSNTKSILNHYQSISYKHDFKLCQSVVAILSQDKLDTINPRKSNPYHDLDFWSDTRKSVYRPQFTIAELKNHTHFNYIDQQLVLFFSEKTNFVEITCINVNSKTKNTYKARKLVLCCGAINTARLVATSTQNFNRPMPILCNHNKWIAGVNLRFLGQRSSPHRYSLSQLTLSTQAMFNQSKDQIIAHFYSYKSLMLFRLTKELPLHPFFTTIIFRLLQSCLTLVNVHFPDYHNNENSLIVTNEKNEFDIHKIHIRYPSSLQKKNEIKNGLKEVIKCLLKLRVLPLKINNPQEGASIHYAGTVPQTNEFQPLRVSPKMNLWTHPSVYLADSSTWNYLPAKGLTFTIMANSRKIGRHILNELRNN